MSFFDLMLLLCNVIPLMIDGVKRIMRTNAICYQILITISYYLYLVSMFCQVVSCVLCYFAVNLFVASTFLQGPLINDAAVQKVH